MDKGFEKFVREAMEAGKNIICVTDISDIAHCDGIDCFVSLKNHKDIAEANEILGLGTYDYIYIENRWSRECTPFDFDGYRLDIGIRIIFKDLENERESTEEFKKFWNKLENVGKHNTSIEIFNFMKHRKGSMIIDVDIDAMLTDSTRKEAWHELLHDMAYKFNGMIYKSELYD